MPRFQLTVPIIGILRGIPADFFSELMKASFGAGLQALEVTMNTAGALDMIRDARPHVPPGRLLGMGTIRNQAEAEAAHAAGAMFMVTPNTDLQVIAYCRGLNIPIIAGAFTPTEVFQAWQAGADLVKVFPCGPVGPGYIKELLGPFDQLQLVAVGGVNLENLGSYFKAGAVGVGVGTTLFGKDALERRNGPAVAKNVGSFLQQLEAVRAGTF
ncbi:MAG: bifunctional 4-hydroxy-2-oxoglutarate aldolase/2-dehydro-3-deoxy-phosphogluconate aldolase [Proteobacteria bacterium]|nr:bifunctional 4-hydroxy-2-oxoglutarate aldolase/2-dehydro-3-deoxy-phosphogluconate aldolase [Pseudomonadota bacterium]MBU1687809.1 bifunctional 4-hydroxy-2-oxoglutarate aldolase/2-dehydro-3-deoxy-phosphogluconate aldolase [Pseudomonadota bacterium]